MVRDAELFWDASDGPSPLRDRPVDDGAEDRLCHLAAADFPSARPGDAGQSSTMRPTEVEAEGQPETELRKQISIFVPLSDWKAIRHEAARLRIPMTELCKRWMKPDISRLRTGNRRATSES